MGDVNWDGVKVPQPEDDEPKGSGWLGTVAFVLLLIVGVIVGGAYLNTVMLGERVRAIAVDRCAVPTCIVDVRLAHPDCYSANVVYAAPTGIADFQTSDDVPRLGIGTVDLDAYIRCVIPAKPATLADESP